MEGEGGELTDLVGGGEGGAMTGLLTWLVGVCAWVTYPSPDPTSPDPT